MIEIIIRDSEAGNVIQKCDTLKEALNLIEIYEGLDKLDGTYTPNFYEISINSIVKI